MDGRKDVGRVRRREGMREGVIGGRERGTEGYREGVTKGGSEGGITKRGRV